MSTHPFYVSPCNYSYLRTNNAVDFMNRKLLNIVRISKRNNLTNTGFTYFTMITNTMLYVLVLDYVVYFYTNIINLLRAPHKIGFKVADLG